jgi:hypothetical protein
MARTLFDIPSPDKAEIWRVDGRDVYIMYEGPSGVPLVWRVRDPEQLSALFGPGQTPSFDREMTGKQFSSVGAVAMGHREELAAFDLDKDPFEQFADLVATEAQISPWLRDESTMQVILGAMLEGRAVTEGELKTTDYWKTHNEQQRAWLLLKASDPRQAERVKEQAIEDMRDHMTKQLGIVDPPEDLVNLFASALLNGRWSSQFVDNQLELLMQGRVNELHKGVRQRITGPITAQANLQERVREIVRHWLGPQVAQGWTEQQLSEWALKLQSDPNAEVGLTNMLKKQRLALFPTYDNPELSYDDIVAPWVSFWQNAWGEIPDETDSLFQRVVNMNDSFEAGKLLRSEGLNRNKPKVVFDMLSDLARGGAGGSQIVRSE